MRNFPIEVCDIVRKHYFDLCRRPRDGTVPQAEIAHIALLSKNMFRLCIPHLYRSPLVTASGSDGWDKLLRTLGVHELADVRPSESVVVTGWGDDEVDQDSMLLQTNASAHQQTLGGVRDGHLPSTGCSSALASTTGLSDSSLWSCMSGRGWSRQDRASHSGRKRRELRRRADGGLTGIPSHHHNLPVMVTSIKGCSAFPTLAEIRQDHPQLSPPDLNPYRKHVKVINAQTLRQASHRHIIGFLRLVGPYLESVSISGNSIIADTALHHLACTCSSSLTDISLHDIRYISDYGLGPLLEATGPALRRLSLVDLGKVGSSTARAALAHCHSLESLELRRAAYHFESVSKLVVQNLGTLRYLCLRCQLDEDLLLKHLENHTTALVVLDIPVLRGDILIRLVERSTQLNELRITSSDFDLDCVEDELIFQVAERSSSLEVLTLFGCWDAGPEDVLRFDSRRSRNVKNLNIIGFGTLDKTWVEQWNTSGGIRIALATQ